MKEAILIWLPSVERPSHNAFIIMRGDPIEANNVQVGQLENLIANAQPRQGMLPWIWMLIDNKDVYFDPLLIRAIRHAFCEKETK